MATRILGPTGSRRRKRFLLGPILAVAALALFFAVGAQAVHTEGIFELDRNAVNNAAVAGNDWDQVFAGASTNCASLGTLACSFDADPPNATIFTGGGSKDINDLNQWRSSDGSVPDKDEIDDAYSAMYVGPPASDLAGHQILYFGADRHANNGSSDFGFWFFKSSVSTNADGTFSGVHTVGDVLLLSTFTTGGATTTIRAFKWVGSGGSDGALDSLGTSLPDCVPGPAAGDAGCGTVNALSTTSPWPYTPKSGPSGSFPSGSFFEGGVDLTQLQVAGCFSSFLAETRSSPSTTATLKDYVLGSFTPCKAKISITPTATNEVGTNHTFTIQVQKLDPSTGFVFGGANGVTVTTSKTDSNGANSSYVPGGQNTCTTAVNGTCTVTITSPTAGQTTVNASATVPFQGGGSASVTTNGTGGSTGPAVKTFVDAKIGVSPLSDTDGITELHTITATVQQDNGSGSGFSNAPNGTLVTFSLLNDTATTTFVGGVNTCTTTAGSCSIQITSTTAGSVDVHATTTFSVGGVSLTRATGTGGNNSADANKVFVDGTLRWLKHDQDGNPLGGATFRVCRTANFNSSTGMFDSITPVCVNDAGTPPDVIDNGSFDQDPDAGEFQLNHLILGRYTIHETIAPAGYQADPDTETVELTVASPSNIANPPVFVDVRQFKLIVITCNQSTNALVVSSVTLNGVTKDTIAGVPASLMGTTPAITQSNICDIGGASYGNLNAGTYVPSVLIPKP